MIKPENRYLFMVLLFVIIKKLQMLMVKAQKVVVIVKKAVLVHGLSVFMSGAYEID